MGSATASATATHALMLGAAYVHSTAALSLGGETRFEVHQRMHYVTAHSVSSKRRKYVQDARARGREEDKEPDVQEDRNDRAAQLRDELVPRLRAQEVSRLQVA